MIAVFCSGGVRKESVGVGPDVSAEPVAAGSFPKMRGDDVAGARVEIGGACRPAAQVGVGP